MKLADSFAAAFQSAPGAFNSPVRILLDQALSRLEPQNCITTLAGEQTRV